MADKKITQLPERISTLVATDVIPLVGNTVTGTPTNYKIQVKNFLAAAIKCFSLTANTAATNTMVEFTKATTTTPTHMIKMNINGADYWVFAANTP